MRPGRNMGPFMSLAAQRQTRLPPPDVSPWQPHPAVLRFIQLRPMAPTVTDVVAEERESIAPWRYR
jgi:hypothetical protein